MATNIDIVPFSNVMQPFYLIIGSFTANEVAEMEQVQLAGTILDEKRDERKPEKPKEKLSEHRQKFKELYGMLLFTGVFIVHNPWTVVAFHYLRHGFPERDEFIQIFGLQLNAQTD